MKTETFHLELITPCFSGGAQPDQQAEIRSSAIRGQLRWWFRTLAGFKSLAPMPVAEQEAMIFGSTADNDPRAGKLITRVLGPQPKSSRASAEDLGGGLNTALGYALFPLRPFRESDGKRAVIANATRFELSVLWHGSTALWDSVRCVLVVWSHLGGLGFRSRRTLGALQLRGPNTGLSDALSAFNSPTSVVVKELDESNFSDWRGTSAALLKWYRSWRQHGQMHQTWVWNDKRDKKKGGRWTPIPPDQQQEHRSQPGFRFARRDHNEGLDVQGTGAPSPDPEQPAGDKGETFRSALGLPIIQYFSSLGDSRGPIARKDATVTWDERWNESQRKGAGRFASPILLRPYRDAQENWHALVIFVDSHKWPAGKQVFLNGQAREVSLELYETMQQDPRLRRFL